jgi:hypothetical protein
MLHQDLSAHPGVVGIDPSQMTTTKAEDVDIERASMEKKRSTE